MKTSRAVNMFHRYFRSILILDLDLLKTIYAFNSRLDRLQRQQYTLQWKHAHRTLLTFNHQQSETTSEQIKEEDSPHSLKEFLQEWASKHQPGLTHTLDDLVRGLKIHAEDTKNYASQYKVWHAIHNF